MVQIESDAEPWWAVLTVWIVVNAVNTIQGVGFLSRIWTGKAAINHSLGYLIIALAIPATAALVGLVQARAGWLHWVGPAVFLVFVTFLVVVDYLWQVEFRSPARAEVVVPFLVLFFGAIFLMGLPMFRIDTRLWAGTVVTTAFLLVSMTMALRQGVG
jgi:hypothetical protein